MTDAKLNNNHALAGSKSVSVSAVLRLNIDETALEPCTVLRNQIDCLYVNALNLDERTGRQDKLHDSKLRWTRVRDGRVGGDQRVLPALQLVIASIVIVFE